MSTTQLSRLRLLFFGFPWEYSCIPLQALLEAGAEVAALVVPRRPLNPEPVAIRRLWPPAGEERTGAAGDEALTTTQLAWRHDIPVHLLSQPGAPDAVATLASYRPDLALVVGFPHLIPPALLATPSGGFLNLHPSLLPAYRGPNPLFRMLRAGETTTGVTLHYMDERFDTGDIVSQAAVSFPDGASGGECQRLCAQAGAKLLLEALARLQAGDALPRRPQPASGSYFSHPSQADFALDAAWPARRAFNFMRGTEEWGNPYMIKAGGLIPLKLRQALSFDSDETLAAPLRREGEEVAVQFTPGVLRATV